MATRNTQFSRTMEYFRTAALDEAQAALDAAVKIMGSRIPVVSISAPRPRKTRKSLRQVPQTVPALNHLEGIVAAP